MMKTSIIIPTYDACDMLEQCIASIRMHTKKPYEIIVVDNGSSDRTLELCQREAVTFISLPENLGFPAACNIGLKVASGDALLLLNNDVLVASNWLTNMLACLNSHDQIGIVGPYSNYVSGPQMLNIPFTNLDDMAKKLNRPNPKKWLKTERIVGLCFLFKRTLMNEIGLLDEQFSPGHYEDDDYCLRAKLAGYHNMIAGDVFIYHHGSVSFRKQGEEQMNQLIANNRQKFINKWGFVPQV